MVSGRRYLLIPRAVVVSGRHLLLVREGPGRRSPSPGRWHLPGGEVLEGEGIHKAVERLVKHRSGLAVEVVGCLDALTRRGADPTTGKPGPVLHLYFLCRPAAETPPESLPDPAAVQTREVAGRPAPPGGFDWGWTDLESGLAALNHDLVGPAVISHLQSLAEAPRP